MSGISAASTASAAKNVNLISAEDVGWKFTAANGKCPIHRVQLDSCFVTPLQLEVPASYTNLDMHEDFFFFQMLFMFFASSITGCYPSNCVTKQHDPFCSFLLIKHATAVQEFKASKMTASVLVIHTCINQFYMIQNLSLTQSPS